MSAEQTHALIASYYDAFNREDHAAILALLSEDVVHDINQGGQEIGRDKFAAFLKRMDGFYRERSADRVVMTTPDGARAAVEFVVHGEYLKTEQGLPPATGQKYALPVGAFFAIRDGKITRVTNYYNLPLWVRQINDASA
ncbi:nuclear transport factor 2 family protein [Acetobacter sp. TBRC 12305]|uniref:Nuclear transport factor 2 family protein n=1 Tax=Acetobacter garciniae TaxID=2817435 RepID=A0A939HKM9_9PROT|nr:ketosteroid isomerase-related protein [Acetobacter garciniae]MBO1326158.1 nuclear transport factor 2 family protein [Acetobacter garciniae]MBX0345098.1 nuclear transport factor 2 family protein [Acetobacter garciniae]